METIRANSERTIAGPTTTEHASPPRPHIEVQAATHECSISVVVPAFNEQDRIAESLSSIHRYLSCRSETFELLVVDDGSTDSTCEVVESFAAEHPHSTLIRTSPNRGKGHAVRIGVLRARGSFILFSDADLATPIEELESLLSAVHTGRAVAIGSRAARGAVLAVRQPWYRELAGRSLNQLVRRLAVPAVRDTQCGFKLFRRDAAHDLFGRSVEDGFGFDVEVLHLATRRGYSVAEVPVAWRHREGSKVRIVRDSMRMLGTLRRIVCRDLRGETKA